MNKLTADNLKPGTLICYVIKWPSIIFMLTDVGKFRWFGANYIGDVSLCAHEMVSMEIYSEIMSEE